MTLRTTVDTDNPQLSISFTLQKESSIFHLPKVLYLRKVKVSTCSGS